MSGFAVWFLSMLCAPVWAQGASNDQGQLEVVAGYTSVSPSDLEILRRQSPSFPQRALRAGYTHEECVAQMFVNEDGKVDEVHVDLGCPEAFHSSVTKAAKKWRFEPYIGENGEASPITFALRFRFQRED